MKDWLSIWSSGMQIFFIGLIIFVALASILYVYKYIIFEQNNPVHYGKVIRIIGNDIVTCIVKDNDSGNLWKIRSDNDSSCIYGVGDNIKYKRFFAAFGDDIGYYINK